MVCIGSILNKINSFENMQSKNFKVLKSYSRKVIFKETTQTTIAALMCTATSGGICVRKDYDCCFTNHYELIT